MSKCPLCNAPAGFDGFCSTHRKPVWLVALIIALPIFVFIIINQNSPKEIAFDAYFELGAKEGDLYLRRTTSQELADRALYIYGNPDWSDGKKNEFRNEIRKLHGNWQVREAVKATEAWQSR